MRRKSSNLSKLIICLLPASFGASNEGRHRPPSPNAAILASSPRRATFFDSPLDIDSDFRSNFMPRNPPELPNDYRDGEASDGENRLPHSPVIYRYYGKRRSRTRASGSIPFILLGPNVDHWKTAGEHLAARGFSVIACERDPLESDAETVEPQQSQSTPYSHWIEDEWWKGEDEEAANLISNLLQASRWSKAILVACDSEAKLAIQAAFRLAPEKIAGLVLCGDLKEITALLKQSHPDLVHDERDFAIDAFLNRILPCPFAIAWDGETTTQDKVATPSEYDGKSPAECLHGNRCFILGGGVAPHRRQPETFAWTLTRFVEDKVAPSIPIAEKRKLFRRVRKERKATDKVSQMPPLPKRLRRIFSHSVLSGDFFSSGSFVVYGRIIASALLYGSMLKVAIHQYGSFLNGAVSLKTRYDIMKELKMKINGVISGFFINWGYIPLLFQRKESDPEPDPSDFVTALGPDDGNFEHGDDMKVIPDAEEGEAGNDAPEAISEEPTGQEEVPEEENSKESESVESEGGTGDESDGADEGAATDDPPFEDEKEDEEERHVYRPLFFLDRVVALESSSKETQQRA